MKIFSLQCTKKLYGIKISETQDGNPYHNAIAERINGILKEEFGFYGIFDNLQEAGELCRENRFV